MHIVFFAAIALLALGPKRFPDFTRTLANTVRGFREVVSARPGLHDLVDGAGLPAQADAIDATPAPAASLAAAAGEAVVAGPPAPEPPSISAAQGVAAPPPAL